MKHISDVAERSRGNPPVQPCYRIFGLTLSSDFSFANPLAPGDGKPDLTFTCVDQPPVESDWASVAPAYASPLLTAEGESLVGVYRLGDYDVLHFAQVADFYLWTDRIVCHLLDPAYRYLIEIRLLGTVLSYWLERSGIPMLHASAVSLDGRAAAFLASNKGGKSALAAGLMRMGHPLLSDDIVSVEQLQGRFHSRSGYPAMRMWPEQAAHFNPDWNSLELVHPELDKRRLPVGAEGFGEFRSETLPLACFYLPERRNPQQWGTDIEIVTVPPVAAVVELARHSFIARVVQALGWQTRRLELLSRIVQQVPVRRLLYPSGYQHLPLVCQHVSDDCCIPKSFKF